MGIDLELIGSEGYNLKIKNRLRDFYTYQFKHNQTDFYDKGNLLFVRMLAGCILIDQCNITKDDIFIMQMKNVEFDSENDTIYILLDDESNIRNTKKIRIKKSLSKIISLLYIQEPSAFFLTGTNQNPNQERYIAQFENALDEYEKLKNKKVCEIVNAWTEIYLMVVNNLVKPGTFRNDSERLKNIMASLSGVEWKNGDVADLKKGVIDPKKKNAHIECVTVDGRNIPGNPFFELYKHCDESSTLEGQSFSLIYFLIMHFNIGNTIERYDYVPIKEAESKKLDDYLIATAVDLESKSRRGNIKSWRDFSSKEKRAFGTKAIEKLCAEQGEIRELYDYILFHNRCIILENDHFVVKNNSLLEPSYVEKNDLFRIYNQYRERHSEKEKIDIKQFGNRLQYLTRLGILKSKKSGDRLYYTLSNVFINDILRGDGDLRIRFFEMISFFSQVLPLGEVGNYIQERISEKSITNTYYKHRYINRALNDYNLIDLLNAIQKKLFVEIEYRNATMSDLKYQRFFCYPLEIRESVTDGRMYLLYYSIEYRSVSAVRIDFIDSIKIGTIKEKDFFAEDIERAEKLIAYTWGTSFDGFRDGNVIQNVKINKVRVILMKSGEEFYIERRLLREGRNCINVSSIIDETYGYCLEIKAELVDFKEMIQWLRSFICRIISFEVNGDEYVAFYNDIIETAKLYNLTELSCIGSKKEDEHKKETLLEIKNKFTVTDNFHTLLFNEVFSQPFNKIGDILFRLLKEEIVDEIIIKKAYKNMFDPLIADDREMQLDFVLRSFVLESQKKKKSTMWTEYEKAKIPVFSLKKGSASNKIHDLIPLTTVEIQWLHNVLNHPMATGFLTTSEIKMIKYSLPKINLFDVNKVVLYDQFLGMDSFYQTLDFGNNFRKILMAIREHKSIKMEYYNQYGEKQEGVCYPSCIEYSKRDNIIRVKGIYNHKVKLFNVERIRKINIQDETFDHKLINSKIENYEAEKECSINVFFKEEKGVPSRILTEFSCFKKICIKWGTQKYRMTLFYNKDDAKEILVRLLSYGASVFIDADDEDVLKKEYFERIQKQLELIKSRKIIKGYIEKQKTEHQR